MTKRGFNVSTDIVGMFGGVSAWFNVWDFVLEHPNFMGLEMLGWRGTRERIFKYQLKGVNTVGIHGQTEGAKELRGLMPKAFMTTVNLMMDSPQELVTCPTEYLLFHVKSTGQYKIRPPEGKRILIENDCDRGSLDEVKKVIKQLKKKNIKAGTMFDLVHYLRSEYGYVNVRKWDQLLFALEKYKPTGIHIPIGLHTSDSLPIEQISQRMWRELGGVLLKIKPRYKTIEDQMERQYSLVLPGSQYERARSRNERIIDLLTNAGVL